MIQYGIVGLMHGSAHLEILAAADHTRVVAVCDRDETLLEPHREAGIACYTDFSQMLRDEAVRVVVIATPIPLHVPMAIESLEAGKHVFLEKPVGSNLQEIQRLQRCATAHPELTVQIGLEFRSSPLAQEVRHVIDAGTLGRVHQISWTNWHPKFYGPAQKWKTMRKAGGPLFDESSHWYSLMQYWLDSRFTRAVAFGGIDHFTDPEREVEDNGVMLFEFENKARVQFGFVEFLDQPSHTLVQIAGSAGKMTINMDDGGSYVMYSGKGQNRTEFKINPEHTNYGHLGFDEQHDFFVQALTEGQPVITPLEVGVEAYLMGLAALRSIQTGSVVTREQILNETPEEDS